MDEIANPCMQRSLHGNTTNNAWITMELLAPLSRSTVSRRLLSSTYNANPPAVYYQKGKKPPKPKRDPAKKDAYVAERVRQGVPKLFAEMEWDGDVVARTGPFARPPSPRPPGIRSMQQIGRDALNLDFGGLKEYSEMKRNEARKWFRERGEEVG